MPTTALMAEILSTTASGTYQRLSPLWTGVTSRSGVSDANFSTLKSPHVLPTHVTAEVSTLPSRISEPFCSPKTPTGLMPRSHNAPADPACATILVGLVWRAAFWPRSSVNSHGPPASPPGSEGEPESEPQALSAARAAAETPPKSSERRLRVDA